MFTKPDQRIIRSESNSPGIEPPDQKQISQERSQSKPLHWFPRLIRALVFGYLVLVVVSCSLQDRIIFPGSSSQGEPYAQVTPTRGENLIPLTLADGTQTAALFGTAIERNVVSIQQGSLQTSPPTSTPTVIFFYGNGDHLANVRSIHTNFRTLGFNALFPEYPGYGIAGGSPGESAFYNLVDELHAVVTSDPAIDPNNIIIVGQSIGSGSACYYATKYPTRALILISPFTSLVDAGKTRLPFVPISWLIKHRFDNVEKWPRISAPTLIISGTNDSIVPHSMSIALRDLDPVRTKLFSVRGGGHNNIFENPESIFGLMQQFVKEHPQKSRQ